MFTINHFTSLINHIIVADHI